MVLPIPKGRVQGFHMADAVENGEDHCRRHLQGL